jgi:UDP-N-acetylglucosamine--N-acetylmuramyl-(pentapeptide) pyrophosphoryl-undecaprenol N-acetylglucosamine transferase
LDAAFTSADLCVSRAGASVLGEYPIFGLPSVLVPYPFAGAPQERNADFMVRAGAAVKLADRELHRLAPLVEEILRDRARLSDMALHCKKLARPEAATSVAALLRKCAEQKGILD